MADHSSDTGRQLQPHRPPEGISESDYEAIEDAVMETARGRWFLKEYARRMRAAETASLHAALQRIERAVAKTHLPEVAGSCADMQAMADLRFQIDAIGERLLDISWYMRERGIDGAVCASIDTQARTLGELGATLGADDNADMNGAARADDLSAGQTSSGHDIVIEAVASEEIAAEVAPALAPATPAPAAPSPSLLERAAAFIHIDRMPARQRLALFA